MTVVFAPFIDQIGRVEPYVSVQEVKFSPTASDLDLENLVSDSSQTAQDRALYELIVRASAKVDNYIFGRLGTLNATSNTQNGRYQLDRSGRFKIHPSFTPVIAVSDFSWGISPGNMSALALTTSNVWIEEESIIVLPWNTPGATANYSGSDALGWLSYPNSANEYYTQFTIVNGYPNTFTSSAVAAGATSLPITDPTGIYPGTNLTIWDGVNDEYVSVSSSYVAGSSTLTLAAPLQFSHGTAVNVSQMHPSVKQATIHFIVGMVKERGQGGGFEISPAGEVTPSTSGKSKGFSDDELAAYDLLDAFKSISGRM